MKLIMASWATAHGLADLIISGRLDGPLALKEISGPDREMLLSRILLKALA